jgi:hypothetical protein
MALQTETAGSPWNFMGKNLGGSKAATVSSSACERLRKKPMVNKNT